MSFKCSSSLVSKGLDIQVSIQTEEKQLKNHQSVSVWYSHVTHMQHFPREFINILEFSFLEYTSQMIPILQKLPYKVIIRNKSL